MKMKAQPFRTYGTWQKAVVRGKFITMSSYTKNTEILQINDLMLHLKLLENKNKLNVKQTGEK
jgi:hypothetical protein